MFNIGELSKLPQTLTVPYFSYSILYQFESEEISGENIANFEKGGLVYKMEGAGAASK
jgi:hypothetical protein